MNKKRTAQNWWVQIKTDPEKFTEWLKKQYHGEFTAASRIRGFLKEHVPADSKWRPTIEKIASQEEQHAAWVGELLVARGITAEVLEDKAERYWDETLPEIKSFESGAAVAAHAEEMRLERIRLIVADDEAPEDVRNVFSKILKEEEFHAKAFSEMAGGKDGQAMAAALEAHERGLEAINLIPGEGF